MSEKRRYYMEPKAFDLSSSTVNGQKVNPLAWCNPGGAPHTPNCAPTGFAPTVAPDVCGPGNQVVYLCTAGSSVKG